MKASLISRLIIRTALVLIFVLSVSTIAGAYTLVMHGGRQIIIPDRFTATSRSMLTYEASPGINVSVRMSNIDIAATDRVNGEAPGSFLKRLNVKSSEALSPARNGQKKNQRLTLTNADLEASKAAREKSEREYAKRRLELGLPPVESQKPSTAEQDKSLREALAEMDARQQAISAENYWRARAGALRTDILALDGQINFLRSRLIELRANSGAIGYAIVQSFGGYPLIPDLVRQPMIGNPINYAAIGTRLNTILPGGTPVNNSFTPAPGFSARLDLGGVQTRGSIGFRNYFPHHPHRRHRHYPPHLYDAGIFYSVPYNNSYESGSLTLQLQELETARAGLHARWRALEDEARRAGAPPGWLRP